MTGETQTTTSADTTTIAYQSYGEGPAIVVVGGATNRKEDWVELVQALGGDGFTGVTYDRRGRGDSGDTSPYAVEREIEDLASVITAVAGPDGTAGVHGVSSGGALANRAAAAGVPIRTLSTFEAPYRLESAPPAPSDYVEHLQELYDADRAGDMFAYFLTAAIGQPQEAVDQMRQAPFWDSMAAIGRTILYDGLCLGGSRMQLPTELLGSITIPMVCFGSTGSPDWLRAAAEAAAGAAPDARYVVLEGEFHSAPTAVLAPALAEHHGR
jgi:pimeloyl-ACP methyl ester carboxylesterase